MSRLLRVLLLLLLPASLRAQGGPPMITDDPGTAELHTWEINTAWVWEKSKTTSEHEIPLLDFNYGFRSNVQLKLEFPYMVTRDAGVTHREVGAFNAGVKWRFIDHWRGLAVSTYPQLELPNAFFLPLEAARSFRYFDVNVDGGIWLSGDERRLASIGLAVGRSVSRAVELMAECNGNGVRLLHPDDVYCGPGARVQLNDRFIFIGAYEPRVNAPPGDRPAFHSYLGIQTILR